MVMALLYMVYSFLTRSALEKADLADSSRSSGAAGDGHEWLPSGSNAGAAGGSSCWCGTAASSAVRSWPSSPLPAAVRTCGKCSGNGSVGEADGVCWLGRSCRLVLPTGQQQETPRRLEGGLVSRRDTTVSMAAAQSTWDQGHTSALAISSTGRSTPCSLR